MKRAKTERMKPAHRQVMSGGLGGLTLPVTPLTVHRLLLEQGGHVCRALHFLIHCNQEPVTPLRPPPLSHDPRSHALPGTM